MSTIIMWIGIGMIIVPLSGAYFYFWWLALTDDDPEGVITMILASVIIGAVLALCAIS